MTLIQKEIKRVTIRPGGVEKQIRPVGWKPGANTIAYYKFDGNLNDSSGNNRNLSMATGSFTYGTESGGGKYVLTNKSAYTNTVSMPLSTNWTISFYACSPQSVTNSYGCNFIDFQGASGGIIQLRGDNKNGAIKLNNKSVSNTIGNWDYYTVTASNSTTRTVYKNGVNIGTYSADAVVSTNLLFRLNSVVYRDNGYYDRHSTIIKLGELIVEGVTRTAQEISDYYNQTKANYGL